MLNGQFNLDITLGDDAMQDGDAIAAALIVAAKQIKDGATQGAIHDTNGNRVGTFYIADND